MRYTAATAVIALALVASAPASAEDDGGTCPAGGAGLGCGRGALEAQGTWRVVYYHSMTGRGEQVRLLLRLAGVNFEDVRLEKGPGPAGMKTLTMGDASPLVFDQTPIIEHDGFVVAQTAAIMQYIGELFGLDGGTPRERAVAQMITLGSEDMRVSCWYGGDKQSFMYWMGHFERHLRKAAAARDAAGAEHGPFVLGPKLTYADVALFDCVWHVVTKAVKSEWQTLEGVGDLFPRLSALATAVRMVPRLKEYMDRRGEIRPGFDPLAIGYDNVSMYWEREKDTNGERWLR